MAGGTLLGTDPAVEWGGVDAGYSPTPGELRAPDIAIGSAADDVPGWIPGAPPLAVEFAGPGQDETELQRKIADLLGAGTRWVWVVRLIGPQRVEVYEQTRGVRTLGPGDTLEAPGVLQNSVPVRAFFDREIGFQLALRNLLQRQGYPDLEAVLAEGRLENARRSLLTVLDARGFTVDEATGRRIEECVDAGLLEAWLRSAAVASELTEIFGG